MTRKPRRAPAAARWPDDACPRCGTTMARTALGPEGTGERRGSLGAVGVAPPMPEVRRGGPCGSRAARRLQEDAIAVYRKKHGLLSADEIRAVRERFGLTQSELARLLHLGANTISRWESGRNVQTEAMEMLLRLLRDLPGSLEVSSPARGVALAGLECRVQAARFRRPISSRIRDSSRRLTAGRARDPRGCPRAARRSGWRR